ncbi:MAG: carbon-nitrogen hydrolase family protein [bacterium]|nr:MAG: carbon-nitrogen hydrolase family protein [bacterium]
MKIALIQQHATRDKADNIARGVTALEEAAAAGAQLVAFAELAFEFFWPQYPATGDAGTMAERVPGPTTEVFAEKAQELSVVVVLNLFERDGTRTYDCSPVIDADGRFLGKTRMVHVIEAPCFHESGYYTPGDLGAGVFDTAAGRIGVAICYDRHFPEYMRALALKGAELVVVPQAGAVDEWPPGIFEAELQIASFHNGYFSALVNRIGEEETLTFAGESFVAGPDGRVLARAPKGSDHILICDVDLASCAASHARRHFIPDRRPEIYGSL